jgi:hypothetical protein
MQIKFAWLLITGSVKLRYFFVVWVPACSADIPSVKRAGMPKFEVKSMPQLPATAEVLPIEMDGIFELKVEVVGPNRQKQPTGKPTSGERRTDRLVGVARIPQRVASRSAGRKVRSKQ